MRITRKTKNTLKTILGVVLIIGAVLGISALINSAVNKTDDGLVEISPKFEVGGLTDTGKYEDTKLSLYTKESFGCEGLKITVDFDSNVQYQAYFYDENDNFVSKSDVYDEGHTFDVSSNVLKARIELTPIWDSDVEEKDKELGFFDVRKYSKQLTIQVSKTQYESVEEKQNSLLDKVINSSEIYKNYELAINFENVEKFNNKGLTTNEGIIDSTTYDNFWITDYMIVESGSTLVLSSNPYKYCFYTVNEDDEITFISSVAYSTLSQPYNEIVVPENVSLIRIQFTNDNTNYPNASAVDFTNADQIVITKK